MNGDTLEAIVTIKRKIFYNKENSFGIISAVVEEILSGSPTYSQRTSKTITIKGSMAEPIVGNTYTFKGEEVEDKKYGNQYNLKMLNSKIDFAEDDDKGKRKYLESLFTPLQVEALYDALEDPYQSLKDSDYGAVVQVKGVGMKTANSFITRFHEHYDRAKIYVELEEYELTGNMVNKLLKHYSSVDLVIQKVKDNPYSLVEVAGIGWKKCDAIALKSGMPLYSTYRVQSYMHSYLEERAENGCSWIDPDELMCHLVEALGEELPDEAVSESVNTSTKLWFNDEHTKIGLKKYKRLEEEIAKDLGRLLDNEPSNYRKDYQGIIKETEIKQGWEFCDEQLRGLKMALSSQVSLIIGFSGSGKSSLVSLILKVLDTDNFAQCSLSGKAASRLTEVTGEEGFTIHRLLGYPKGEPENGGFLYNAMNKLPYDVIIVDEISMVDEWLFSRLIRSIKDGAKLILLGDNAQLPAIGCGNIATDLLTSKYIPSVILTQIHRQAAKSGMVTESINVRKGVQIIPSKEWVGIETRGELQDFTIDCYSDRTNTYYKIIEYFNKEYSIVKKNIMDLQVIVPRKDGDAGVKNLNLTIQELVNWEENGKDEILVSYGKDDYSIIRVGDKVINVKNNYNTINYNTKKEQPIYNGSIGIVKWISPEDKTMIVTFNGIGDVLLTNKELSSIELAYAVTLHKYQGSECKRVIYALDYSSYSLLTREHVYTGITRAKEHTTLVAQNSALRYAIAQHDVSQKQTFLVESIEEVMNPKFVF